MEQPIFLSAPQESSHADGVDAVLLGATTLPENPFVGLRPFESKEAVLFFGRREQTKQLLSILHASRFVAVVGSSGCGKSSLIRAGLIPNLQAGFVAGNVDRWNIVTMKPGNSPLQNLATALLNSFEENPQPAAVDALVENIRLLGVSAVTSFLDEQTNGVRTNFLLLVDQFEEIFRFAAYDDNGEKTDSQQNKLNERIRESHREEAVDLVSIMLALVAQESIPVYVVMTMRSDFLGECDAFYGLPEAMNKSQYLVPRLTRQQRQQAIENPVLFYGAAISDRLTDRVLNDMEEERDQLPIMQHALMRTWEKWQLNKGGSLDLSHYLEAGTVAEALSRDADDAMKGLSKDERVVAERMFQALTTTDAKGRRLRRPTHLSELAAITGSKEVVLKLIDRFRDNNRCFLMLSADRDPLVDISHESLIRQWSTLRKWVDEEVTSREMYLRLANDAVRHKAKEAPLWSDPALQLALNWWSKRKPNEAWGRRYHKEFKLTEEFLKTSEKKRNDDAKEARRLQDERARREREDLEKAQRQAEIEKIQAQELADARERELRSNEKLYRQRATTIRRTRWLVVVLAVTLLGVAGTAAWAVWTGAEAKRNEAKANDALAQLEVERNNLRQSKNNIVTMNASLITERDRAEKLRDEAVKARADAVAKSVEAKKQEGIAIEEKAKADQTGAADQLRRKAANEQNAGEPEEAQSTYLKAVEAYKGINDTDGVAYTYSELGNMFATQQDETAGVRQSSETDRQGWDGLVKPNWVERVLLDPSFDENYFNSIGVSRVRVRAFGYYAHAIKAYRESGGESGLNGAAVVLEKVGDVIAGEKFKQSYDPDSKEFAERQRLIATRDAFCMALENFRQAGNAKRQIALLNKIGDGLETENESSSGDEKDSSSDTRGVGETRGCKALGDDPATYYEESVKLYPSFLSKYDKNPNQFRKNQQSYVDLLVKLGTLYAERAETSGLPTKEKNLKLAEARFETVVQIFRAEGDLDKTANIYKVIGDRLPEGDLKVKYYQRAAEEYRKAGKVESEAALLAAVGQRYLNRVQDKTIPLGNRVLYYNNALPYLLNALRLYKELGKDQEHFKLYENLGTVYLNTERYDEGLAAYQTALNYSQHTGDPRSLLANNYNIGRALEAKGDKEGAKKYYEETVRLAARPTSTFTYLQKQNAENALKRLRGELAPANVPKNQPINTAKP
jgi:energy-coupling factor transporter ATP-binding protein EcfA2